MALAGPQVQSGLMTTVLDESLAVLDPQLGGVYVFVSTDSIPPGLEPFAVVREAEGLTLIVSMDQALQYGYADQKSYRRITIGAVTALDSVGVTATLSQTIASRDIPCNVVAGYYHDHLFVPSEDAQEVMALLRQLAKQAEGWLPKED